MGAYEEKSETTSGHDQQKIASSFIVWANEGGRPRVDNISLVAQGLPMCQSEDFCFVTHIRITKAIVLINNSTVYDTLLEYYSKPEKLSEGIKKITIESEYIEMKWHWT